MQQGHCTAQMSDRITPLTEARYYVLNKLHRFSCSDQGPQIAGLGPKSAHEDLGASLNHIMMVIIWLAQFRHSPFYHHYLDYSSSSLQDLLCPSSLSISLSLSCLTCSINPVHKQSLLGIQPSRILHQIMRISYSIVKLAQLYNYQAWQFEFFSR